MPRHDRARALLAALLTGLGAAGTARAATVDPSASYVLVNRGSGKVLDVSGASTADGAGLTQWTRTDGANQRFRFVDSGGGYYRLKAQHSGKVLDVLNYSTADHADIAQWSDAGGTNQQFRLADSPDGYVRLINRNSGKAAEVENASTADGAKVVQYTDWGGANQQWQLVRASGVLAQVHTAGRVTGAGNTVQYSWPGVYFEGRISGTGVGIVLNDSAADYDVQVDGTTVATLVTPGDTTHWINGLQNREHTVRLVKRDDTPGDTSTFGGFVAAPGGAVLSKPAARDRQIEFIGDSLTVGYGNLSTSRTCTWDQVRRNTNSDMSYGALTARQLNADYQINGYSGLGMVRNYNGGSPDVTYRAPGAPGSWWSTSAPTTSRPPSTPVSRGRPTASRPPTAAPTATSSRSCARATGPARPSWRWAQASTPAMSSRWSRRATTPATAGSATGSSTTRAWTSSAATGTTRPTTTESSRTGSPRSSPVCRQAGDGTDRPGAPQIRLQAVILTVRQATFDANGTTRRPSC
ncbi:RICIN domain-containing protein [Streptomyces mirabilis]|uniref:RICIN domain-containing protein n=1 Tax=Streptomyces mirabilis TaxID=68239 RepID=UPI003686E6DF